MDVTWERDGEELYAARVELGSAGVLHLVVEELCDIGWDWQVWDAAHQARLQYGLADGLDEAKSRAERAVGRLAQELAGASAAAPCDAA